MKGGDIKRLEDVRYPAFWGALLDILPRCIDRKEDDGVIERGHYSEQLTYVLSVEAYDAAGHRKREFMRATCVGPYPSSMQRSWVHLRGDAALSYGLTSTSTQQDWSKLGPLSSLAPTDTKNRGAADRKPRPTESAGQRLDRSTTQSI